MNVCRKGKRKSVAGEREGDEPVFGGHRSKEEEGIKVSRWGDSYWWETLGV